MIASNTRAVLSKAVDNIKKTFFITTIIVQCVFFVFYAYSIYTNLNNIIFLITYSLLFLFSLVLFILFLKSHKKKEKARKFVRILRFSKYLTNGVMLVVNTYELLVFVGSDLAKIFLIISAISLFVQIAIELIKIFAEHCLYDLELAIEMDFGFLVKAKEYKGNFFELVDAPLQYLANRIENKKNKEEVEKDKIKDLTKEFVYKKKLEKEEKKEEIKQRSNENAKKQIQEIKKHTKTILNSMLKKNTPMDNKEQKTKHTD